MKCPICKEDMSRECRVHIDEWFNADSNDIPEIESDDGWKYFKDGVVGLRYVCFDCKINIEDE